MTGRRGRREGSYCIIILSLHTLNFTTHNADVCMYVCMYICMYLVMYACMHVCMYVRMYVICMYVCMYVCVAPFLLCGLIGALHGSHSRHESSQFSSSDP